MKLHEMLYKAYLCGCLGFIIVVTFLAIIIWYSGG
jgi:hypothetical protein